MIKPIHPFPARMAPQLALDNLKHFKPGSMVLDPMAGSGTVLRQASELGHRALGFDTDPLAVLMAKVWTTPVDDAALSQLASKVINEARCLSEEGLELAWLDQDQETLSYVTYWFAEAQRQDLRRLASALSHFGSRRMQPSMRAVLDVLRLALSRIIVTKAAGASLARDASHSRPHKVAEASNFQVIPAFERSVRQLRRFLSEEAPKGNVMIKRGDARSLRSVKNCSIDVVLTSPPYLNAIDYMRGHRLALVWLGYPLSELREIRSNNIGSERAPACPQVAARQRAIRDTLCEEKDLSPRYRGMVARYAQDIHGFMFQVHRVLKPGGRAVLVVGNSCLKGTFIRNADGVVAAAERIGLKEQGRSERDLPPGSRYLPMPKSSDTPLGKRMRTETILTFERK